MVVLYGRAGCLTAQNGGFRPGQVAALLWACMALRPDPVAVFELRRHRAQRWGELRVAGWALALLAALLCYLLVGPRVAACCFVLVAAACAALLRA